MVEQKITLEGSWTAIKAVLRAIDEVENVINVEVTYHD